MRFSIVTPSFNQAPFLEQALRSVLEQAAAPGAPEIEYIVLDGGSTDGSADLIRKYAGRLAYWESAPDRGQADAILRGFARATGDVLAWLNSDDYYLPGALAHAARCFERNPGAEFLVGGGLTVDPAGRELYRNYGFPFRHEDLLHWGCRFTQPASFWRRDAFEAAGGFDSSLHFCFDYDMYLRLTLRRPAIATSRILAAFRIHPESKTSTLIATKHAEDRLLWERYGRFAIDPAQSRAIARRAAVRHFLRKAPLLACDSLANPAMAWREIRRRGRTFLPPAAPNPPA